MNATILLERLTVAAKDDDGFNYEQDGIVDELPLGTEGLELVAVILRFMEQHPDLDYGAPGPLVHYMEKFYRQGYEERLVVSIERHPIVSTVLMVNRVVNGTKDPEGRQGWLNLLKMASEHPAADEITRELAVDFYKSQVGGS